MATSFQIKAFNKAIGKLFPTANIDRSDASYVRVEQCRTDFAPARMLLTEQLTEIGTATGHNFDGYDEDGSPCFSY